MQPLSDESDAGVDGNRARLFDNVLEDFIPGYRLISHFFIEAFGFDRSTFVWICFICFGLFTSVHFFRDGIDTLPGMSFVTVKSNDEIWKHLIKWLGDQGKTKESMNKLATTEFRPWDTDKIKDHHVADADSEEFLNFRKWLRNLPPRYEPYLGKQWIRYEGRSIILTRKYNSNFISIGGQPQETMTLGCFGFSTEPIEQLIRDCRIHYFEKKGSWATIYRPAKKDTRSSAGTWTAATERPLRPVETVVLDGNMKRKVLKDMNEFLHPSTKVWYANRGIPYRRGYLLYGPPGTGKSSLSFAIAGIFGLDVFCISLSEPELTDEDLCSMFSRLPARCVVLLEDIDSAGLTRRGDSPPRNRVKDRPQSLSLSGLLNAIDGAGAHEDHVLILTTNFRKRLDDALIRPGRVDMQVEFQLASREEIRELFILMYSAHIKDKPVTTRAERVPKEPLASPVSSDAQDLIHQVSDDFAKKFSNRTFTAAQIQGFLLERKWEPHKALREVDAWIQAVHEEKRQGADETGVRMDGSG